MAGSLDFTRAISIKYQLKYTGVLPNGTYSGNPMYGNETCTSGTTWNYTAGWPIIQFNVPRCYVFIDPKNVTKIYMFASYYCPQGYIALQSACRIAAPGAPSVLGLVVSGTAGWPDSGNGTTTGVLAVCGYFFQPEAQPGRLADFDVTCVPTRPANGIASAATTRAPLTPAENNELALKFLAGDEFGKN